MAGYIILGAIADRLETLSVACSKCDRRGRYHTAALVTRLGANKPAPQWLREISADCPKRRPDNPSIYDLCGIHCPDLGRAFNS